MDKKKNLKKKVDDKKMIIAILNDILLYIVHVYASSSILMQFTSHIVINLSKIVNL